jgi:hypothetical protein
MAPALVSAAACLMFLWNSHEIFLENFTPSEGSRSEPESRGKIKFKFNSQIIAKTSIFVNAELK